MFRATDVVTEAFAEPFVSRWIFDVEVLARLLARRRRDGAARPEDCMYEYPLPKWEDVGGSKLALRDYWRAALELSRIWRRYDRG